MIDTTGGTVHLYFSSDNGLFATGTIVADSLKVHYQDFIDFDDELYVLIAGVSPR